MIDSDLVTHLSIEARRVATTELRTIDAAVPWCGDWRVGDVIGHLAGVQRWATRLSSEPGAWTRRRDMERPPLGRAVLGWYESGVAPMLRAYDADLDTIVKTWAGDQPRRWWLRRLVHETTVHRWDVQAGAAGIDSALPIDTAIAIDGIDELLENFLPLGRDTLAGTGQTMHLHATDAASGGEDGEWWVCFDAGGPIVERTHAHADVGVRGSATDLLLLLWNRRPISDGAFDTGGDIAIVERWQQLARF